MAKKEQLDFGQIEVDGDMDFDSWEDSFMQEPKPKKERGVILEVASGLAEGVVSEVANADNVVKFMRNSLPEGYGEAWTAVDKVSGSVVDLYDTAVKELKPGLGALADKVDRLVPEDSKIAKGITTKLKSWFGSEYKNYGDDAKGRQDKAVGDMIQGVFATQMQQQEKQHQENAAESRVEKAIDNKRFDINANILSRMEASSKQTAEYTTTFNMQFQKKSLELQYRSYLTTVDLLQHIQKSSETNKQQLEAVVRNTAMPEFVKIKTSERIRELVRDKLFTKAHDAMFGSSDRLGQGLKTMKGNFKDLISSVKQGVEAGVMGADALQMVVDMEQQMAEANGEAGPNWFKKTGMMAGGMGAGWAMNKASDFMRETGLQEEGLVKGSYTAANYARSPDMLANKILESEFFQDDRYGYDSPMQKVQELLKNTIMSFGEKRPGGVGSIERGLEGGGLLEPTFNDAQLRKVQVDVVPGYLARILREVTVISSGDKQTKLIKYDMIEGRFKTETKMVKDIQETIKKQVKTGMFANGRKSTVRSLAQDDITDQQRSELEVAVGKIATSKDLVNQNGFIKSFTKDPNILRQTAEYQALSEDQKAVFEKHIMSGIEGDSVEAQGKLKDLYKNVLDMRGGRADILQDIKQRIVAGQADELISAGIIIPDPDGKRYSINMDLYNQWLHTAEPATSDVNTKEKIKPVKPKSILSRMKDKTLSALGVQQPEVTSDVNTKEEITPVQTQQKTPVVDKVKKQLLKAGAVFKGFFGKDKEAVDPSVATSDANAKEEVQPVKPKGILDRIRGIKVFNWQYKDGKESEASKEAGGGEKTHTGPMAQTVNAKLGADAAPGGTKLDLISMNGYNMAAIQELADKVDSIVKDVPFLKNILAKKAGKEASATEPEQQQLGLDLGDPQPTPEVKKEGWGTRALNQVTGLFNTKDSSISSQTEQPLQPQVDSNGQVSLGLEEVNQEQVQKLQRSKTIDGVRNALLDLVTPASKEQAPQPDPNQQILFEELKDSNELKEEQTTVLGKILNWLGSNAPQYKEEKQSQAQAVGTQEAIEKKNREGLTELDYLKAITENTDSLIELANSGKGIVTQGQGGNFAGVKTGNAYIDGFTQLAQLGLGLIGKGAYDAGTGAIKATTATAQATGKFLDKHKESIKDAGKWVFNSIADLTLKGLELGKKTLTEYLPKGLTNVKEFGKKIGKLFEKFLNGAEDIYIAGMESPVITKALMKAGHYHDAATGKVIETIDDIYAATGDIKDAAGVIVLTVQQRTLGIFDGKGKRLLSFGKKAASLAWAGAAWAGKKLVQGASALFDKAKKADFKIPGLDWAKDKISGIKDSFTGLGFYDRRSYDVLVQIRDLMSIGKPKKLVEQILGRKVGHTPTKDFKPTEAKEKQIDKQKTEKFEKVLDQEEGKDSGEVDLKEKWGELTNSLKDLFGMKGDDSLQNTASKLTGGLVPQKGEGLFGKLLGMFDKDKAGGLKEKATGFLGGLKDAWDGKKPGVPGEQMSLFEEEPAKKAPKGKLQKFFGGLKDAWEGKEAAPEDGQAPVAAEEKPKGRLGRLFEKGKKYLTGEKAGAAPAEPTQAQQDMFAEPTPASEDTAPTPPKDGLLKRMGNKAKKKIANAFEGADERFDGYLTEKQKAKAEGRKGPGFFKSLFGSNKQAPAPGEEQQQQELGFDEPETTPSDQPQPKKRNLKEFLKTGKGAGGFLFDLAKKAGKKALNSDFVKTSTSDFMRDAAGLFGGTRLGKAAGLLKKAWNSDFVQSTMAGDRQELVDSEDDVPSDETDTPDSDEPSPAQAKAKPRRGNKRLARAAGGAARTKDSVPEQRRLRKARKAKVKAKAAKLAKGKPGPMSMGEMFGKAGESFAEHFSGGDEEEGSQDSEPSFFDRIRDSAGEFDSGLSNYAEEFGNTGFGRGATQFANFVTGENFESGKDVYEHVKGKVLDKTKEMAGGVLNKGADFLTNKLKNKIGPARFKALQNGAKKLGSVANLIFSKGKSNKQQLQESEEVSDNSSDENDSSYLENSSVPDDSDNSEGSGDSEESSGIGSFFNSDTFSKFGEYFGFDEGSQEDDGGDEDSDGGEEEAAAPAPPRTPARKRFDERLGANKGANKNRGGAAAGRNRKKKLRSGTKTGAEKKAGPAKENRRKVKPGRQAAANNRKPPAGNNRKNQAGQRRNQKKKPPVVPNAPERQALAPQSDQAPGGQQELFDSPEAPAAAAEPQPESSIDRVERANTPAAAPSPAAGQAAAPAAPGSHAPGKRKGFFGRAAEKLKDKAGGLLARAKREATGGLTEAEQKDNSVKGRVRRVGRKAISGIGGAISSLGGGLKGLLGGGGGAGGGSAAGGANDGLINHAVQEESVAGAVRRTVGKVSAVFDKDNDGRRDGDATEQLEKQSQEKANRENKSKQEQKEAEERANTGARYRSDQNVIDTMLEKASGVFGFLKDTIGDLLSEKGMGKLAGRALGGLKNVLGGAGKMLGRIGTPIKGALQAVGNVASKMGGVARVVRIANMARTAITVGGLAFGGAGGAVLAAAGTALSAVATALASPVVLGALAVGAVAYGAYKAYKYFTRNSVNEWEKLRIIQYGLDGTEATKEHNSKFMNLEGYLQDGRTGYDNGKAKLLDKKIDHKEMLGFFDIDEKDEDAVNNFSKWFGERFKPFYLNSVTALFSVDPKAKLEGVSKLDPEKQRDYLNRASFFEGPYDVDTSPLKGLPSLNTGTTAAKAQIKELEVKVGEKGVEKKGDQKEEDPDQKLKSAKKKEDELKAKLKEEQDKKNNTIPPESAQTGAVDPDKAKREQSNKVKDQLQKQMQPTGEDGKPPAETTAANPDNKEGAGAGGGKLVTAAGPLKGGEAGMQFMKLSKDTKLENMHPTFLKMVSAMAQEYGETTGKSISINEAFRTRKDQERLHKAMPHKAAKPGGSMHEKGLAMDISTKDLTELERLGLMRKYGLTRPVGGETHHVESSGVQMNIQKAKDDPGFADMQIKASAGRGGGGFGTMNGSALKRRNAQVAKRVFESGTSVTIDLEKEKEKTQVANDPSMAKGAGSKPGTLPAAEDKSATGGTGGSTVGADKPKAVSTESATAGLGAKSAPMSTGGTQRSDGLAKAEQATHDSASADFEPKPKQTTMTPATETKGGYKAIADAVAPPVTQGPEQVSVTRAQPKSKEETKQKIGEYARETKTPAPVLQTFAAIESGMNPNPKSSGKSSAAGAFQFLKKTWREQLNKHGPKYGLSGNTPPTDLRAATVLASEYIEANKRAISGVKPSPNTADLYMAHFLGAGGAQQFFRAPPNEIASKVMPKAAGSNPGIFKSGGRDLTISEVYDNIVKKVTNRAREFGIALTESIGSLGGGGGDSKAKGGSNSATPSVAHPSTYKRDTPSSTTAPSTAPGASSTPSTPTSAAVPGLTKPQAPVATAEGSAFQSDQGAKTQPTKNYPWMVKDRPDDLAVGKSATPTRQEADYKSMSGVSDAMMQQLTVQKQTHDVLSNRVAPALEEMLNIIKSNSGAVGGKQPPSENAQPSAPKGGVPTRQATPSALDLRRTA